MKVTQLLMKPEIPPYVKLRPPTEEPLKKEATKTFGQLMEK
jgi:hypothetical protein